jgi:acyl-CoA reductase-like NAD-dependent aldehyde dehydrogenase
VAELATALAGLEVGDRADPATVVAPLVYPAAVSGAAEFFAQHSGHVMVGGRADVTTGVVEPSLLVFGPHAEFHPPELFAPIVAVVPYSDAGFLRDWAEQPLELRRGMYCSVFGEPAVDAARLGTAVVCRNASALDIEDGNQPFGGYGAQASSVHQHGRSTARPLLLSEQAARISRTG